MVRPLWIEVNLKALRHNFKVVRHLVGRKTKIIATVKQSAYGHGLIPVAQELAKSGVDYFGVGSIEEAQQLRAYGLENPILVLSVVQPKFAQYFIEYNCIPTVVDLSFARRLNREAKKRDIVCPVHVKIDTGMGRLGLYYTQAEDFILKLSKLKNIKLEGIFTHFPVADTDKKFTNTQIAAFNKFILRMEKKGIKFSYHHCANSIGIFSYVHSHFNMVRPGLILYGVKPASRIHFKITPVLSLKSRVIFIKGVEKGMGISYGRTFIAKKRTRIVTVAIGYADGYPWTLSNRSEVIIRGKIYPVVGRVCMDHIMVDIGSNRRIKAGDEVVLIGTGGKKHISAGNLAQWAHTIPYEIVSGLSLKIPRVYKHSLKR